MTHAFDNTVSACCAGVCCVATTMPAAGQAITPESLQGSTVVATVNYDVRSRNDGQEITGPGSVTYRRTFGAAGAYTGSVTRTGQTPRGPTTGTQQYFPDARTRARSQGGIRGHSVWLLSGNTLRMLRTYEVGGKNATITFGPGARSCSIRSPFMRESGTGGAIRREGIGGRGSVEIISARQVSSSCQVTGR